MPQNSEKIKITASKVIDAKAFKTKKRLEKDKNWNDIITKLVLTYKKTDEELKDLVEEMRSSKET